ncbi:hypothetical protein Tco_1331657, partial [Tanacetum coccineum]
MVYWLILARKQRTSFLSFSQMPLSRHCMIGVIQLSPSSSTTVRTSWHFVDRSLSTSTNTSLVKWLMATDDSLLSTSAFWFMLLGMFSIENDLKQEMYSFALA